ncbi:MAG TPA: DUF2285 domain-containing protein [Rhizomicrobium sp.]
MSGRDAKFVVPDWTNGDLYACTEKFSRRQWAWEFLRRNPAFRAAWNAAQSDYGIAGYDGSTPMIVSQHDTPCLAAWGCLYCSSPDQDASNATVFWNPDVCVHVLKLHGFPLSAKLEATPFLLRDIACPSTLLEMPSPPQHLLFLAGGRSLQLAIEGSDVMKPVRLMINSAPHKALASAQFRSLQCFNDLRLSGRLYDSHFQRDPISSRMRQVLRMLDGALSGATQQQIAEKLLGENYTSEHWHAPGRPVRDHVRRALRRGYAMMNGGYRKLLS